MLDSQKSLMVEVSTAADKLEHMQDNLHGAKKLADLLYVMYVREHLRRCIKFHNGESYSGNIERIAEVYGVSKHDSLVMDEVTYKFALQSYERMNEIINSKVFKCDISKIKEDAGYAKKVIIRFGKMLGDSFNAYDAAEETDVREIEPKYMGLTCACTLCILAISLGWMFFNASFIWVLLTAIISGALFLNKAFREDIECRTFASIHDALWKEKHDICIFKYNFIEDIVKKGKRFKYAEKNNISFIEEVLQLILPEYNSMFSLCGDRSQRKLQSFVPMRSIEIVNDYGNTLLKNYDITLSLNSQDTERYKMIVTLAVMLNDYVELDKENLTAKLMAVSIMCCRNEEGLLDLTSQQKEQIQKFVLNDKSFNRLPILGDSEHDFKFYGINNDYGRSILME